MSIDFGCLRVRYDSAVLRPRPWTLAQSEWAAELSAELPEGPILELCAGAGHIGLHAAVVTGRRLVQVDGDRGATRLAAQNAAAAGVTDYEIRCATVADAAKPGELFPLIVADPPYIPSGDVGRFPDDPPFAIDGGADGLDGIRDCLAVAATHLATPGSLLLQVGGPSQADAVCVEIAHSHPTLCAGETRVVDADRAVMRIARYG